MAAQQEEQRHQHRHRQQQSDEHRRQHQVAGRQRRRGVRRAVFGDAVGDVLPPLLLGQRNALRRRTEAAQQREDGQGDDGEHGDLAEGIETAKIDQDHVDHVETAAQRERLFDEEGRDAVDVRAGQHRVGERRQPDAAGGGDQQVAQAPQPHPGRFGDALVVALVAPGKPAQAEQEQHRGDDLDGELGERKIGRREPDEGQAGGEPGAAGQDQRCETVVLGLPGGGQRAAAADQPEQDEGRIGGRRRAAAERRAEGEHRQQRRAERNEHQHQQLHLQASGRQQAQDAIRAEAEAGLQPLEGALAVHALEQRHLAEEAPLQGDIDADAAGQRGETHQQRQVEAVPDGQAVSRRIAAENRIGRGFEERADGERREDSDEQAGQHQQRTRQQHPARRLVRLARQLLRGRAEEDLEDETQRIGDAEHPGDGRRQRQADALPARTVEEDRLGEEHFLRQKTVEQRHAGHRRGRHHGQRGGDRHRAIEAREALQVARSGLVVDDASRHEQRGLEGRVVHDVEDRRDQRERAVHTEQQSDQAEMADRRIGQHPFHVLLENRQIGADHQRAEPGAADDPEPQIGAGEHRPQAREQEDAGLHHGRRMQVGRDRRRRRHRVRQPEMEGELGALGQRAEDDQNQRQRVPGVRLDRSGRRQDDVEIVAPGDMPEQQHAAEQRETAGAGDGERHARAAPGIDAVMPVGDEHERGEAGQLPEHRQLQQIPREHDAEHRPHEGEEKGEEARHRIVRRHVIARVDHHQHAHRRDQHGEEPGITIHAQGEVEPQAGRPGQGETNDALGGHLRVQIGDQQRRGEGHDTGQPGFGVTGVGGQKGSAQAAQEGKKNDQEQRHIAPSLPIF